VRWALSVARVALAVGILGLILIPVSLWRHPAIDATYHGFDPNLMAISPAGPSEIPGKVAVTPSDVTLTAISGSHPTVHLVTTPLSFSAVFDARVDVLPARGVPLRIGVWNPAARAGYFVIFDHDHGDVIRQEVIAEGDATPDLVGGIVQFDSIAGPFATGQLYRVSLNLDQIKRELAVQITGGSVAASTVVTPQQAPDLFTAFRPTLTISAFLDQGTSQATISHFVLTVPSQPTVAAEEVVRIDDARATTLTWIALAGAALLCLVAAVVWAANRLKTSPRSKPALKRQPTMRSKLPLVVLLASGAGAYLLANSLLFGLASPHFEIVSSKVWSYVGSTSGVSDLYYRTLLVPAANAWAGKPVHEATFPYGFTKAYYYSAAAWAFRPFSPPGTFTVNTFSFEVLLKAINVLFGLVDAGLVFLIIGRLIKPASALAPTLFFILNPALILVMSVWGSTETVSLFFILGSIWFAERHRPFGAWLMLLAGAFTRPQMVVFAFLLGAVYLRKFDTRQNLFAISWAVLISFIAVAPFALAISPSVPIDYIVRILAFHVGNQQADVAYLGLSPANYSIWTLPLLLVNGQHGLTRMWSPATMPFLGSLSYGQVGGALSVGLLLVVGALLLFKTNLSTVPGRYLPLVAFALLGWMLLTPGAMSRYMIYPIVALILCRAAFSMGGYSLAVGILTAVACITVFGHLASDFLGYSGSLNLLSPTNNWLSHVLFSLFSADWFISLAATANIAIWVTSGISAWESLRGESALRSTSVAARAT